MAEAVEKKATPNPERWHERIAEQERSGMSVRGFCKTHGIAEHVFYYWRKRLRSQKQPVRFALIERGAASPDCMVKTELELVLATGERLRISTAVDAGTLRTVLEALRA